MLTFIAYLIALGCQLILFERVKLDLLLTHFLK
jgi:hypothetical protein